MDDKFVTTKSSNKSLTLNCRNVTGKNQNVLAAKLLWSKTPSVYAVSGKKLTPRHRPIKMSNMNEFE